MTLTRKLLLAFLAMALLIAPILGALVFISARDTIRTEITRALASDAGEVMGEIDRAIYRALLDARVVAATGEMSAVLLSPSEETRGHAYRELWRLSSATGPWDLVSIVDLEGTVRAATDERNVGTRLSPLERELVIRAIAASDDRVSDLVRLPDTPRPTMVFVTPVRQAEGEEKGRILGAVVARLAWPSVLQLVDIYASRGTTRVVNQRSEIVAAQTDEFSALVFRSAARHPLLAGRKLERGSRVITYRDEKGNEVMGALAAQKGYLTYRGAGWKAIVESPASSVNAPVTRLARRVVAVVVLVVLLSAIVFAAIARRLMAPIRSLNETAMAIRAGDLAARATVGTRDEVGTLATSFNDMVETIAWQMTERRDSEAFLESVLNHIPMAVWVKRVPDGTYVRVNRTAARMLGLTEESYLGRTSRDLLPPHLAEEIDRQDREAIERGSLELPVGTFHTPQGLRDLQESKLLIRDAAGTPQYLLAVAQDVTERVEQERRQHLRLIVARILAQGDGMDALRPLLDAIREWVGWPLAMLWLPRDEGDLLQVAACSSAGDRFSDFEEASRRLTFAHGEGIIGEVWGEVVPRWNESLADAAHFTRAAEAAAGEIRSGFAIPIALGSESLGVIELLDVQEHAPDEGLMSFLDEIGTQTAHYLIRMRAERDLMRARDAADEASRAKSDFLARMSHEIRTPLNGIIGMTSLLSRTPLNPDQQEFVRITRSSANLLLSVINDILDFSKIEAGKLTLDAVDFSIRGAIVEAIKPLALRADDAGVELLLDVDPAVPEAVHGDPTRLRQIVVNLVGNAVKFTARGEIVVSAKVEEEGDDELTLHFRVADTGVGIPAGRLQAIFHAFEQADASTTRRFGGTGLGLAITERLVHLMGGRVWVESIEGRGSTFHFTAQFRRGKAPQPAAQSVQALDGLRVLIVDDNATNRVILQAMVEGWHMKTALAASGREAIARLESERFDLLILDANMPETDGFSVAHRLREKGNLATTIMMLTSASQPADAARSRALGVAAYLTKPVTQSDLFDAIVRARSGKPGDQPQSPAVEPADRAVVRLGKRILLAEDNEVNQLVAVGVLEQAGFDVIVAHNGREALDVLEQRGAEIDLVLMDVQMPTMGGLEAIRVIRGQEKGSGRHLPIIALTAHAMREDRERCLEAGADGYVPKPLDEQELLGTIHALLDGAPQPAAQRPDAPLDIATLQQRYASQPAFLDKLIGVFRQSIPKHMQNLRDALSSADAASLFRSAHSIKGSIGTFMARNAFDLASQLESAGRSGDLGAAAALLTQLEAEVHRVLDTLDTMRQSGANLR